MENEEMSLAPSVNNELDAEKHLKECSRKLASCCYVDKDQDKTKNLRKEAWDHAEQARKLAGDNRSIKARAHLQLAHIHNINGNHSDACKEYDIAKELCPEKWRAIDNFFFR